MKAPKNLLKLIYFPDKKLRRVSTPIDLEREDWSSIEKLINLMNKTMDFYNSNSISAPQIGVPYQVFIMRSTTGQKFTVINPILMHITEGFDTKVSSLSLPQISTYMSRNCNLEALFFNIKKEPIQRKFFNEDAAIFQLQYEHLHGKLFIDDLKGLKKEMIMKKLKKFNKVEDHSS